MVTVYVLDADRVGNRTGRAARLFGGDPWMDLTHRLTQYDLRASKRPGYNPYALAHYLGALAQARKRTRGSAKPEVIARAVSAEFLSDFPPVTAFLKALES